MRRGNRSAVLRPLLLDGPLNRIALGRLTGLSGASVTNVISELLEEHLVVEAGTEESEGGRPRVHRINEVLSEQALAYPAARVSIQLGELGRDAVALGAGTLVLDDLAARGGKPRPSDGSLPRPRL